MHDIELNTRSSLIRYNTNELLASHFVLVMITTSVNTSIVSGIVTAVENCIK